MRHAAARPAVRWPPRARWRGLGRQVVQQRCGEYPQPAGHAGRQCGRARRALDQLHLEAMLAQAIGVGVGRREVPPEGAGAMPVGHARGLHGRDDRGHVAVAAELRDEAATGRRARRTPSSTRSGVVIQCSAALLNTASNSLSNDSAWPSISWASTPRARAAITSSGEASTPWMRAPLRASSVLSTPSPQPRSRMRSPARGSSRRDTAPPSSGTKPASIA